MISNLTRIENRLTDINKKFLHIKTHKDLKEKEYHEIQMGMLICHTLDFLEQLNHARKELKNGK